MPTTHTITGTEAVCVRCRAIFPTGLEFDVNTDVVQTFSVKMTAATPCPRCGGELRVGEIYAVLREGVLRMTESGATFEQVAAIVEILRAASERKETNVAAIVEEIRQTAPDQAAIIDYLNKVAPAGGMLAAFLAVLVAILVPLYLTPPAPATQVHVNVPAPSEEAIERAVRKALADEAAKAKPETPPKTQTQKNREKRKRKDNRKQKRR